MAVTPTIEWVREPVQGRSRETLRRILDATERLLGERGFDHISVAEIVAQSKSSVGAFYGRVEGKAALLHCLHERYCDEGRATATAALDVDRWEGYSLGGVLTEYCRFVVNDYRRRVGLRKAFLVAVAQDVVFRDRMRELKAFVSGRFQTFLDDRRSEMTHSDPRLAAEVTYRLVFAPLDQAVIYGERWLQERSSAALQFTDQLTQACLRYLGVAELGAPAPERRLRII